MHLDLLSRFSALNPNSKTILNNSISAFAVKGLSLIVSFFAVPAYVNYFNNNEILGIWYTLLSMINWFLTFDLGIGNGVRNQLVEAIVDDDRPRIRSILSSGFFSSGIVALFLSLIIITLVFILDLKSIFRVQDFSSITLYDLRYAAIMAMAAILLRFFLQSVTSFFYALQLSRVNNYISLAVSILQLLYVLLFHFEDSAKALRWISISFILTSNLPIILTAVYLFSKKYKDCRPSYKFVDISQINHILQIGGIFFGCQILYMLIINTNEFLITNYYGAQYTVEYTFYYKLSFLIPMLISLAMTPVWSMVTKVSKENNWLWLKNSYSKLKLLGYLSFIPQFLIIPCLQFIMNIWLQDHSITVSIPNAIAFAIFGGLFSYSTILSNIVCGLSRMRIQFWSYLLGVIFKFLVIHLMYRYVDSWIIVVWSNVLVLLPYCIIQQLDLNKFINSQLK